MPNCFELLLVAQSHRATQPLDHRDRGGHLGRHGDGRRSSCWAICGSAMRKEKPGRSWKRPRSRPSPAARRPKSKPRKWRSAKNRASKSSSTSRGKSSSSASGNSTSSRTWSQQRADQLQKQEKMVESNQRKLAEKLEDANRRQAELDNLLDIQRQTLHKISGMSPEEAKTRLLERLDRSWPTSRGADPQAREGAGGNLRRQGQGNADHVDAAVRRRPHRRGHHQHGRHSQRRNEGPHHRPRRPQHPRVRKGDRRRRDHRRHAGRGDRQRVRSGPPRDRPHRAQQADRRRPHPSVADRRAGRRNAKGNRAANPPLRRRSGAGSPSPRPQRAGRQSAWAGCTTAPATARTCCGIRSKWRSSPA